MINRTSLIVAFWCLIAIVWQTWIGSVTAEEVAPALLDRYGDPLPSGATARLGAIRWRKLDAIWTISYSQSGDRIMSFSKEASLLWSVKTGKTRMILRGSPPVDRVRVPFQYRVLSSATLTPDGNTLIAGIQGPRNENYIELQDVESGKERRRFKRVSNVITALAVSNHGDLLASGEQRGRVLLWDIATGEARQTIETNSEQVQSIAFSKDDKLVAALRAGNVQIIDIRTAVTRRSIKIDYSGSDPVLSPDARYVARLGERAVWLWDLTTGVKRRLFDVKIGNCRLAFGLDGKKLVTLENREGDVRLWDVATGKTVRSIKIPQCRESGCSALALSPDSTILATVEDRSCIHLWDTTSGRPIQDSLDPITAAEALAYSEDSRILTAIVPWHGVYRWQTSSGRLLEKTRLPINREISVLQISPDAQQGALANDQEIILWDLRTGASIRKLRRHTEPVTGIAFSGCGTFLASSSKDGAICLWEVATGKLLRIFHTPKRQEPVIWVAVRPDKRVLAGGEGPLCLHLWDIDTGKHLTTIEADRHKWEGEAFDDKGWQCRFTPDGNTLIAADSSNCLVWDLLARAEVSIFSRSDVAYCLPLALSPDGRLLARFDGQPCMLGLWELASGKLIYKFRDPMFSVAFSHNGRSVATSCHADGSILLWDLKKLFQSLESIPGVRQEEVWLNLASPQAPVAYRAIGQLMSDEKAAVALFRKYLHPVEAEDSSRAASLIQELDSDEFDVRVKASQQLEALRESAKPFLERAKASKISLECRRRVETILGKLRPTAPESLREIRAVQVLEYLRTSSSSRLLRSLAGGPEARLTRAAKASLRRLDSQ
jgi:WD40 repeat protein